MKFFSKTLLVIFGIFAAGTSQAQQVFDQVSIAAGYSDQSFYSMDNGEISNVSNTDWDLAFQITGFQAAIRINGKNNVRLFRAGLSVNDWSNITAMDTVGKLNPSYELFDQDTSWWVGAFNTTNDTANQFDLGWGVYDFATHAVTGDSLFFIKTGNGVVKKIWIQSLTSGIYYFAYADVDGTNEINATLNKATYSGKNFGYYSIVNGAELNREPNKYDWDLTFCQYMAVTPITYKVAGVLSNDSVFVAKAYPVDVNAATFAGQSYSPWISAIGYDWKSYDFNNNAWAIADSLVYFVQARNGNIWKMVFTGFSGSSTGTYEFYKEPVSTVGLAEASSAPNVLSVYPNPASTVINLVYQSAGDPSSNSIRIFNATGQMVLNSRLENTAGLHQHHVDLNKLSSGFYTMQVLIDGKSEQRRLVISR